jgi:hypothetical protein
MLNREHIRSVELFETNQQKSRLFLQILLSKAPSKELRPMLMENLH